jgi:NAD(P)-dependent dehydrogenase (short-subunit alcohol dehydrogenase family)
MTTQTVIITGGATGLGYAIAEAFLDDSAAPTLRERANVVLNGRTFSKLETAAQKLDRPDRIHLVAGDITDPTFAPKLVDEAVSRFGRVNVLIERSQFYNFLRIRSQIASTSPETHLQLPISWRVRWFLLPLCLVFP